MLWGAGATYGPGARPNALGPSSSQIPAGRPAEAGSGASPRMGAWSPSPGPRPQETPGPATAGQKGGRVI
eukprot:14938320-Alexandrium_andersonii.AAC.1